MNDPTPPVDPLPADVPPDLLEELLACRQEMLALAREHGLSPRRLAEWAARPENRRVLEYLRTLGDQQAQVLASRYRHLAVTRLIQLAGDREGATPEVARRACVDLLKLDLSPRPAGGAPGEDAEVRALEASLRRMVGEGGSEEAAAEDAAGAR